MPRSWPRQSSWADCTSRRLCEVKKGECEVVGQFCSMQQGMKEGIRHISTSYGTLWLPWYTGAVVGFHTNEAVVNSAVVAQPLLFIPFQSSIEYQTTALQIKTKIIKNMSEFKYRFMLANHARFRDASRSHANTSDNQTFHEDNKIGHNAFLSS